MLRFVSDPRMRAQLQEATARALVRGDNAAGSSSPQTNGQSGAQNNQSNFAPASAPVLPGQTRVVWVLGADGKPQARRIKIGLTDGVSTEVVEGNLQEGELAI